MSTVGRKDSYKYLVLMAIGQKGAAYMAAVAVNDK
jgi:hypothetical protein